MLFNSNSNDALIIYDQIDELQNNFPSLFNDTKNNILLSDAAYDSNKIRNKLKDIKFGYLLVPNNLRNTFFYFFRNKKKSIII
jgi:hypothetical protein